MIRGLFNFRNCRVLKRFLLSQFRGDLPDGTGVERQGISIFLSEGLARRMFSDLVEEFFFSCLAPLR